MGASVPFATSEKGEAGIIRLFLFEPPSPKLALVPFGSLFQSRIGLAPHAAWTLREGLSDSWRAAEGQADFRGLLVLSAFVAASLAFVDGAVAVAAAYEHAAR